MKLNQFKINHNLIIKNKIYLSQNIIKNINFFLGLHKKM
jgi:hypothetical protein